MTSFVSSPDFVNNVTWIKNRCQDYGIVTLYGARSLWSWPSLKTSMIIGATRAVFAEIVRPSCPMLVGMPLALPSVCVRRVAGENESLRRNIGWLAPVSGIALTYLAASSCYAMVTSSVAQTVIRSVHTLYMRVFVSANNVSRFLTLGGTLSDFVLNPARVSRLTDEQTSAIDVKAKAVSAFIFLTLSIGLTFAWQNPILADTVAYPLTTIIELIFERCCVEIALYRSSMNS